MFFKKVVYMNKKKLLLLLTTTSFAAVAVTAVVVSQNIGTNTFESAKATEPEYSLSIDKDSTFGTYAGKGGAGFTYTNSRGTTFGFFKTAGVTKNSHDAALYYDGNQDNCVLISSEYNSDETLSASINGIKSITVDYGGTYYQDEGTPDVIPTIYFGFVSGGSAVYTEQHVLEDNVAYNFGGLLPSCFKIVISNATATSKWYRGWITSLSLTYSCTESDTMKNAWLDDYFATTPKNIVRDGDDKVVSFESGAYPQSKADAAASSYLEIYYPSLTPIFADYYYYNGYLYQRAQAKATGYNNEYTVDNYYWFKVEPLKWNVVQVGSYYLATTEKVLNGRLAYHTDGSATSVKYRDSSLKITVDGMFDVMFRNVGSIIKNLDDTYIEGHLYPLSHNQYGGTNSERISLPTEYARLFYSYSSLTEGAQYWTNRINYNYADNKNYVVGSTGLLTAMTQNNAIAGVRPGITIEIE